MHAEAAAWVAEAAARVPRVKLAVELGARDFNGSARGYFRVGRWIGVDVAPGQGVNVIADAATYWPPRPPELVLCTEVLEHAPAAGAIVANAGMMLAPGGWLVLTAACPPRAPHSGLDGRAWVFVGEHYANVEPRRLRRWLAPLEVLAFEAHRDRGDVYALARKPNPKAPWCG
jgi:Methyltransferase domain